MVKKKICKPGHHSFVAQPGKGLLDKGVQKCLNCGAIKGKKRK